MLNFSQYNGAKIFLMAHFGSHRSRTGVEQESNKSRTERQESNIVEQLGSVATSRGDVKLSEKSYGIKIASAAKENE